MSQLSSSKGPCDQEDRDQPQITAGLAAEVSHCVISSSNHSYLVEHLIRDNNFAQVAKCIELETGTPVAIKVQNFENAQYEFDMMRVISTLDPDKCNIIGFYEGFQYEGDVYLVLEWLDRTLWEAMAGVSPVRLEEIRPILKQLLVALQALESIGIIHSDINMSTVMIVNHQEQPYRVKLTKFSDAFPTSSEEFGIMCQSEGWRAPAIILGLPFTTAIDMWSLGLLASTLFLGFDLCPGQCDYEMLRLLIDTQGLPPDDLLNNGQHTQAFFIKNGDVWKFKTSEEYRRDLGIQSDVEMRCIFKNLHEIKDYYKVTNGSERQDLEDFVDLLVKMLRMDPRERISPTEALQHDFITMQNLEKDSPYFQNSFRIMHVCTGDGSNQTSSCHVPIDIGSVGNPEPSDQEDRDQPQITADLAAEVSHCVVSSSNHSYLVERLIRDDNFAQVAKCLELHTRTPVAIKVQTFDDAQYEFDMMRVINTLDPDKCNLIRFYEGFQHEGEVYLVLELLDRTLWEAMAGVSHVRLEEIRPILKQLLVALQALESIGIIHSDINMSNVMMVNHQVQPYRVKLTEFIAAFPTSSEELDMMCQSEGWRAPEVILGLPFTTAIDMWSLGLLASTLFLGFDLYPVQCGYDMLRLLIDTQGQPPDDLLNNGKYTQAYFIKNRDVWKFKTSEEYRKDLGIQPDVETRCIFKNLHEMKDYYKVTNGSEHQDLEDFVDLLVKMLRMDPRERISPTEALQHDFITMQNLEKDSPYFQNSFRIMHVCTGDEMNQTSSCHVPIDIGSVGNPEPSDQEDKDQPQITAGLAQLCIEDKMASEVSHCVISSSNHSYLVEHLIRDDNFVQVAKCLELQTGTPVAIKVQNFENGQYEFDMMRVVSTLDPDKCNLIRFYEGFQHEGDVCLVLEWLDRTLWEAMAGVSHVRLEEIRPILKQLLVALQALESIGIIHSDISMSNVMIVNHQVQPYRVKLTKFSDAFPTSSAELGMMCQSEGWRAPEVILGLPFTTAIDMWSLGLLASTLFLGFDLYPIQCDYDMLRLLIETQGQPPDDLLINGQHTRAFFIKNRDVWKFKTSDEYRSDLGMQSDVDAKCIFKNLLEVKDYYKVTNRSERQDVEDFIDLLMKMLRMNPRERISPTNALQHDFITMQNLEKDSPYFQKSLQIMHVCRGEGLDGSSVSDHSSDSHMSVDIIMDENEAVCHQSSQSNRSSDSPMSVDIIMDENEAVCHQSSQSNRSSDSPMSVDIGTDEHQADSHESLVNVYSRDSYTSTDNSSVVDMGQSSRGPDSDVSNNTHMSIDNCSVGILAESAGSSASSSSSNSYKSIENSSILNIGRSDRASCTDAFDNTHMVIDYGRNLGDSDGPSISHPSSKSLMSIHNSRVEKSVNSDASASDPTREEFGSTSCTVDIGLPHGRSGSDHSSSILMSHDKIRVENLGHSCRVSVSDPTRDHLPDTRDGTKFKPWTWIKNVFSRVLRMLKKPLTKIKNFFCHVSSTASGSKRGTPQTKSVSISNPNKKGLANIKDQEFKPFVTRLLRWLVTPFKKIKTLFVTV